jgi:23S rRNA pseudouridine1911/1915/1917 synthase
MSEIKIIKSPELNSNYLIIAKPQGMPSAPLNSDDKENAFSKAAALFPELYNVKGKKEIEHGLLHRLDTITSGLLIIAADQKTYENLIQLQAENKIVKTYKALCRKSFDNSQNLGGFPPAKKSTVPPFIVQSYFRPYGNARKEVRPVTEECGMAALKKIGQKKLYSTEITKIENLNDEECLCYCKIKNGFRHQIRSHLAWLNMSIKNDPIYDFYAKQNSSQDKKIIFSAIEINIDGICYKL